MGAQEDVDIVRQGYEAFANADMQWMSDHLTDDVVWRVPGHNPGSGEYRGRDEVLRSFGRLVQATGGTLKLELHDVVGSDEHVVGLLTLKAQAPDGESFEGHFANVFHLEGGKAKEVWGLSEDTAASDGFLNKLPWP